MNLLSLLPTFLSRNETVIKLEQQREYVNTLEKMWRKTFRVCGKWSKPEKAMVEVLTDELIKLREMEASDGIN